MKKVLIGWVVVGAMTGCAQHQNQQPENLNDTVVQVCKFDLYANNETYPSDKPITLIRAPDGKESLKFVDGTVKPVVAQKHDANSGKTFHIMKDYTKQGQMFLGMAYDCK